MSENIEFISAADLPTTEAEEVDVLCVENGELKRKAGATLGGGGGSFVMKLSVENTQMDGNMIMCGDNYDELAKALEAHQHVVIVAPAELTSYASLAMAVMTWMYIEGQGLMCFCIAGEIGQVVFTNGSYVPTI